MKILIYTFLCICSFFRVSSQDNNKNLKTVEKVNPRVERPWGASLGYLVNYNIIGSALTFNYFIMPQIEIEASLGTLANDFFNYTVGINSKYHFKKSDNASPISIFSGLGAISLSNQYNQQFFLQVPVGLQYLSLNGFKFIIDFTPIINSKRTNAYVGIRVGYNFKKN